MSSVAIEKSQSRMRCMGTKLKSGSSVSIVTRLRDVRLRLRIPAGAMNVLVSKTPHIRSGVYRVPYSISIWFQFPVIKRPWREADCLHSSSAKVKNVWSCTSSLLIRVYGVDWFSCNFLSFTWTNIYRFFCVTSNCFKKCEDCDRQTLTVIIIRIHLKLNE